MAKKCDICNTKIESTFLNKLLGTHVKDKKGKKHFICPECQKKYGSKEEMLKNI
ncbi:hypothetical protein GF345_06590 [Candidatus Woesearchaeota archaeon]|nr:hypothetical protein [Candidatus Woesearchaeota archaeon]